MLFLGVDGGNTKTIAVISRANGEIIGYGRSGCSDIYAYPDPQLAIEQIEIAVEQALRMAGITTQDLQVGVFSVAGADYPEDYTFFENAVRAHQFGEQCFVYNDAIGALRAGSPNGTGVSVVCGTGGAVGVRTADGRFWHTSFWQDVGGAHHLGSKLIAALAKVELGILPKTTLIARVLQFFGADDFESVLHRHTQREKQNPLPVARLAPILLEAADQGDEVALQIVVDHGRRFGEFAAAAANRFGLQEYYVILAGSVFKSRSQVFESAILDPIRRVTPAITPIYSLYEPVIGALFLALEADGQVITSEITTRVEKNMPPASLFLTVS